MPGSHDARHLPLGEDPPPGRAARRAAPADAPRPALAALIAVANRLRPRDYTIAALLDAHTALTTDQLTTILFDSRITCRHRLGQLRQLRFVDRFPYLRPGHGPTVCWVPGMLSARYTALARDEPPPAAAALRMRQDRIMVSPVLPHLLDVNDVFVGLLGHARRAGTGRLLRWWSERATAAAYGQRIHPDGHGVWSDDAGTAGFFVELDRGTETIGRLVGKLAAYRRLRAEGGPGYPVVFVLPGQARERHLQQRLTETLSAQASLVVATTAADVVAAADAGVAGPVWWRAGHDDTRVRLTRLPDGHGEPGPFNPGAPPPSDDPLYPLLLG